MSFRGIVGRIVKRRKNGREELSIEWQIRNFFSLSGHESDFYVSPEFSFCNANWRFSVCPNGGCQTSERVKLFLLRTDSGPPKIFITRIGIKGWDDREMKEGIEAENDGWNCETYVWEDFCLRSDLKRQRSKLMPSDILTFTLELKIREVAKGVSSSQDVSVQTDSEFREPNVLTDGSQFSDKQDASSQTDEEIREAKVLHEENESSTKQDASSQTDEEIREAKVIHEENECSAKQGIEKDIGKLLVSGESSDIVVKVRDVEFKAHRAILSVRSPVFFAMFKHETAERASNRVSVSDCEPDAFKEFLHYIYTGSVQLLNGENVFELYRVADKYLADDLKLQCLKYIQDTLCVQTFCSALQLALTHGENSLLQLAIDFASKNFESILCSVEWQKFICEYPMEANEILIKCYCPRSKSQKSMQ